MSQSSVLSPVASTSLGRLVRDRRNARRRARTVDAVAMACRLAAGAFFGHRPVYVAARHGGSVPNNYGYAAVTDGVVLLAVRDGQTVRVVGFAGELPANKVSLGGVAASVASPELRPLWDERYGEARTAEAREAAARIAREHVSAGRVLLTATLSDDAADILAQTHLSAEERVGQLVEFFGRELNGRAVQEAM